MDESQTLPVGVVDCLSSFQVGGPLAWHVQETDSQNPDQWLRDIIDSGRARSGVNVTHRTGLTYAPVWYAVQKIAGHIGMMSLGLWKKTGDRRKRAAMEHPAYRLRKYPNEMMTGSVFRETLTGHAVYRGNGRAAIIRDEYENPVELLILLPDRTRTFIIDGEKWHITTVVINAETGETRDYKLHDIDVLHIPGYGYDGIVGYDVLSLAKESIGLGLAAEQQQARHYTHDARPSILLEAPKGAFKTPKDAKEMLDSFRAAHEGIDNAGRVGLLREGVTATVLSHSARDSQTAETRQIQRQDTALWFALESILGDDSSVSYNSEEQKQIAYLNGALGKFGNKWEEELDRKLLTERQKRLESHYHKLQPGSLLRADTKTTYETLAIGMRSTFLSRNDAREILNLDAVDGGDEYANPNTSTNKKDAGGEPKESDRERDLEQRLRSAVAGRIAGLFDVERARVEAAAQKPDRFEKWVKDFYAAGSWPDRLAATVSEMGGDPEDAKAICRAHCAQLVGAHFMDDSPAEIAAALDRFEADASRLVEAITRTGENEQGD